MSSAVSLNNPPPLKEARCCTFVQNFSTKPALKLCLIMMSNLSRSTFAFLKITIIPVDIGGSSREQISLPISTVPKSVTTLVPKKGSNYRSKDSFCYHSFITFPKIAAVFLMSLVFKTSLICDRIKCPAKVKKKMDAINYVRIQEIV